MAGQPYPWPKARPRPDLPSAVRSPSAGTIQPSWIGGRGWAPSFHPEECRMTSEEVFRGAFASLEVNEAFTEAVLLMRDGTRLCFRHRVGERWVRATGADEEGSEAGLAGQ